MATPIAVEMDTLVTGKEALAMGDIGPYELVEGRIVPMSPAADEHAGYESNFDEYIKAFVRQHKLGKVRVGEVGIYIRRNPDTVRAADVAFISNERYAQRKKKLGYLDVAPILSWKSCRRMTAGAKLPRSCANISALASDSSGWPTLQPGRYMPIGH